MEDNIKASNSMTSSQSRENDSFTLWIVWSKKLLKKDGWAAMHRSLKNLPEGTVRIFDDAEKYLGFKIPDHDRKQYFKEFFRKAGGAATLNAHEIEELLYAVLNSQIDNTTLQDLIHSKVVESHDDGALYNFAKFIAIVCDLLFIASAHTEDAHALSNRKSFIPSPIHPDFVLKQAWDILIMLLLVYSSFQVPYKIVFEDADVDPDSFSPKEVFDIALDVIFMVDVALCFLTSYYDVNGLLEKRLGCIGRQYLMTWFLPDLGGSFPFDKVISLFLSSASNVGALRILKVVRMLKLLRAAKVLKALGALKQREGFEWLKAVIGILQSVLTITFFAHLLGCLFALIFVTSNVPNWMYTYSPSLQYADGWTRYVTAMYWAMISVTTMGYGDIVPVTHNERFFCIFVAMTGAIVFSYCIGTISLLMAAVSGVENHIAEKRLALTEYLDFRKIHRESKRSVKSRYINCLQRSGLLYKEAEILGEISTPLRKSLLSEIGSNFRQDLPLLQGFDDECVGYIVSVSRRLDFRSGETVYRRGDPGGEALIVVTGSVALSDATKDSQGEMQTNASEAREAWKTAVVDALSLSGPGDIFGELALFPELAAPIRHETAVAETFVSAFSLSVDELPALADRYPAVVTRLKELCTLRLAARRSEGHGRASKILGGVRLPVRAHGTSNQPCRIKALAAQLQRGLLVRKVLDMLVPASGPEGSKVLDLFQLSREGGRRCWIAISCVLSQSGELLCLENTPAGAASEQPKSLGFFVAGKSSFRALSVTEIEEEAGFALRDGNGERPHGCSVLTFGTREGMCGSDWPKDVHIFTWMDEDFQALVKIFKVFESKFHLMEESAVLASLPMPAKKGALKACVPFHGTAEEGKNGKRYNDCNMAKVKNMRPLPGLPSKVTSDGSRISRGFRSNQLNPLPPISPSTSTALFSAGPVWNDDLCWSESITRVHSIGNCISQPTQVEQKHKCNDSSYEAYHLSILYLEELNVQLERFVQELLQIPRGPIDSAQVLPAWIQFLAKQSKSLHDLASSIQPMPLNQSNERSYCCVISPPVSTLSSEGEAFPEIGSLSKTKAEYYQQSVSCIATGAKFGSNTSDVNFRHSENSLLPGMVEEVAESIMFEEAPAATRRFEAAEERGYAIQQKWLSCSDKLVRFRGWETIRRDLCALPEKIVKIFEEIEATRGDRFNDMTRKKIFKQFYRKACGSSTIEALDMEDLAHVVLHREMDENSLQNLICKNLSNQQNNNCQYDFAAVVSFLCDLLHHHESQGNLKEKVSSKQINWFLSLLPVHPDFVLKQAWDILIMLLLVYSSFQVPYTLAFEDHDSSDSTDISPKEAFDIFLDVIFMVDVGLCFLTSYYDVNGVLEQHLGNIRKQYLKTWFVPDLGGSFPFDKVISLFMSSAGNVGALRILKVVRMLKLLRAAKVLKAMGELGQKEGFRSVKNLLGILRATFVMVLVAHVLGCFFTMFFVASSETNWMYNYNADLARADDWARYVTALYWAMISITTMGYGDIKPSALPEQLFCILVATVGSVVFSFCMGTISALATSVTGAEHVYLEKVQRVAEYLRFRKVSKTLRLRLKGHYALAWRGSGALYDEDSLLREMPTHLCLAVLREIGEQALVALPLLQGFDSECAGYLLTRLRRLHLLAGERVYRRGDPASEAFFVLSGEVILHAVMRAREAPEAMKGKTAGLHHTTGAADVAEAGDVFGEAALFPQFAQPFRIETAVARCPTVIYSLSAEGLADVAGRYPQVAERLGELCMLRLAERRHRGQAVEGRAAQGHARPCRLRALTAQLQRWLLAVREREVLVPASGPGGSRVLSLLIQRRGCCGGGRAGTGEGGGRSPLIGVSCVVTGRGELLVFEHSPAGVASERPHLLGICIRGRSALRVLPSGEALAYAGGLQTGVGDAPHCCGVLVLDSAQGQPTDAHWQQPLQLSSRPIQAVAAQPPDSITADINSPHREGTGSLLSKVVVCKREVLLFSWLDDDFESLLAALNVFTG